MEDKKIDDGTWLFYFELTHQIFRKKQSFNNIIKNSYTLDGQSCIFQTPKNNSQAKNRLKIDCSPYGAGGRGMAQVS